MNLRDAERYDQQIAVIEVGESLSSAVPSIGKRLAGIAFDPDGIEGDEISIWADPNGEGTFYQVLVLDGSVQLFPWTGITEPVMFAFPHGSIPPATHYKVATHDSQNSDVAIVQADADASFIVVMEKMEG